MSLRTVCPHCGKRLKYEGGMEGGCYKCPKCGKAVTLHLPSDVAKELQKTLGTLKRVLLWSAIVLAVVVPSTWLAYRSLRDPPHTGTITSITQGPTTLINLANDKTKTVWVLSVVPETVVLDGTGGKPAPVAASTLQVGQALEVWLQAQQSTIRKVIITGKSSEKK